MLRGFNPCVFLLDVLLDTSSLLDHPGGTVRGYSSFSVLVSPLDYSLDPHQFRVFKWVNIFGLSLKG